MKSSERVLIHTIHFRTIITPKVILDAYKMSIKSKLNKSIIKEKINSDMQFSITKILIKFTTLFALKRRHNIISFLKTAQSGKTDHKDYLVK